MAKLVHGKKQNGKLKMIKYMFECLKCKTIMSIETNLPDSQIHKVPPCPCGKSRMTDMASKEYAYGSWD